VIFLTSILGLASYLVYGAATQTGPVGYLSALEMRVFGTAETGLTTMVLAVVIIVLVLVPLGAIRPNLLKPLAQSARPQAQRRDLHFTWAKIFTFSAIPLIAGSAIGCVSYLVIKSQDQKVYAIDFSDSSTAYPKDAVFLDVNGLLVRRYLSGYREETNNTKTDHIFAPLAGPGWSRDEPVRYFVHYTAYDVNPQITADLPDAFQARGLAHFTGKISGSLPVIVRRHYQANGLKIAPVYTMIDWTRTPGDQASPMDRYAVPMIASGVGVMTTLIIFFALVGINVKTKMLRLKRRPA
jgi:hypothetical protein